MLGKPRTFLWFRTHDVSVTDLSCLRNFNAQINAIRRRNNKGVYDIHTNTMQYPTIMQPTSARIEQIPPGADDAADDSSQVFPPLSPSIPRNFTVIDTYYENPPAGISATSYDSRSAALTNAGPDSNFLAPFRGLGAVGDDVKDCLPAECREAFEAALARENDWHSVRDISYTRPFSIPSRCYPAIPMPSTVKT